MQITDRIRRIAVVACLAFGLTTSSLVAQSERAELHWRNGDSTSGFLLSATESELEFRSLDFKEPFRLRRSMVQSVIYPNGPSPSSAEPYLVQLDDQNRLVGSIQSLDQEHLVVASRRMGTIKVPRKNVVEIINQKNQQFLLSEHNGLEGWDAYRNGKKHWSYETSGKIETERPGAHLFWKNPLPETARIEIRLEWSDEPNFVLAFGVPNSKVDVSETMRIESWDDSIVLTDQEGSFVVLDDCIQGTRRQLSLSLIWNQRHSNIEVYDANRRKIGEMATAKRARGVNRGIYIQNGKGKLAIDKIRVLASSFAAESRAGLELANGKVVAGGEISHDGHHWVVKQNDRTQTVTDEQFGRLALPRTPRNLSDSGDLIRFRDGTILSGQLISLKDNRASFKTPFSPQPFNCDFSGVILLSLAGHEKLEAADAVSSPHRLILGNRQMRGELVQGSQRSGDIFRWQPVGGRATPFSAANALIRFQPEDAQTKEPDVAWTDTIYFKNRDVIPCRIKSFDENEIHFESFTENSSVAVELVRAIEFSTRSAKQISTLSKSWTFRDTKKQLVHRNGKSFVFKTAAQIAHPRLLDGDRFQFELKWKPGSEALIGIQTDVHNLNQGETSFLLAANGSQVILHSQKNGRPTTAAIDAENHSIRVSVIRIKNRVEIRIDGNHVGTLSLPKRSLKNKGVQIAVQPSDGSIVELGNIFTGGSSVATTQVESEIKKQLLTIPRLMKGEPPQQILVAKNGDLLRGYLLRLNEDGIRFSSRGNEFLFKRDIATAIVWLHPNQAEDSASLSSDSKETQADANQRVQDRPQIQAVFNSGQRLSLMASSWSDGVISGESESLGVCKIPFSQLAEIRLGSYATEALDVAFSDWVPTPATEVQLEGGCAVGPSGPSTAVSRLLGTVPQDLEINLADGSKTRLSELKGKVVVLDFWATWCGYCIKSMPDVVASTNSFESDQVAFFAVNQGEALEHIQSFLKMKKWELNSAVDPDSKIGKVFGATSLPHLVVLDTEGKVVYVKTGAAADIQKKLKEVISKALQPNG